MGAEQRQEAVARLCDEATEGMGPTGWEYSDLPDLVEKIRDALKGPR